MINIAIFEYLNHVGGSCLGNICTEREEMKGGNKDKGWHKAAVYILRTMPFYGESCQRNVHLLCI